MIVKLEKIKNYADKSKVGKVIVTLNNEEIYKDNVYVRVKEKKTNLFSRLRNLFS